MVKPFHQNPGLSLSESEKVGVSDKLVTIAKCSLLPAHEDFLTEGFYLLDSVLHEMKKLSSQGALNCSEVERLTEELKNAFLQMGQLTRKRLDRITFLSHKLMCDLEIEVLPKEELPKDMLETLSSFKLFR